MIWYVLVAWYKTGLFLGYKTDAQFHVHLGLELPAQFGET